MGSEMEGGCVWSQVRETWGRRRKKSGSFLSCVSKEIKFLSLDRGMCRRAALSDGTGAEPQAGSVLGTGSPPSPGLAAPPPTRDPGQATLTTSKVLIVKSSRILKLKAPLAAVLQNCPDGFIIYASLL